MCIKLLIHNRLGFGLVQHVTGIMAGLSGMSSYLASLFLRKKSLCHDMLVSCCHLICAEH